VSGVRKQRCARASALVERASASAPAGEPQRRAESIAVDSLSSLCMAVSSIPVASYVSACSAFTVTCASLGGGAASRLQGEEGERRQRAREERAMGTAEELHRRKHTHVREVCQ
jgi:hypothetical protein